MINTIKKKISNILEIIQFRLDTTLFFLDKPKSDYQPIPWCDINTAPIRGKASKERLNDIEKYFKNISSLKDIGCCVGFFCNSLVEKYNIPTVGIDANQKYIRIANYSSKKIINNNNLLYFNMLVTPQNAHILPVTDSTILFSLWHHWVFNYGLESATNILNIIWSKTDSILFFESGEEEILHEFKLDFIGDNKVSIWLLEYLSKLPNSDVSVLGTYAAGSYSHYKLKNHKRTVFVVKKLNVA